MSTVDAMIVPLMACIVAENVARAKANAAEPYVHAVYADHEERIGRLVALIADGDDVLEERFYEALFDITYDGVHWALDTFRLMAREVEAEREEDARYAAMNA